MNSSKKISDIIDFNPSRSIKRGEIAPFIEMAALPISNRDIAEIEVREFTGGGAKFRNGDTLFARITPCLENGKTAKVTCLNDGVHGHGSTEFIVMSAKDPEYDEDFVYYLARHPDFRAYAQSRMEGTSGRQRVSWQSLAEFEFDYPAKELRKAAGSFLKKLDDKIQLNYQLNKSLEAVSQAIFKSWFVDFDPVRAKIEVLRSGGSHADAELAAMSLIAAKDINQLDELGKTNPDAFAKLAQTAEMFPSSMQATELGDMPYGWREGLIKDVVCFSSERVEISQINSKNYISTENMLENKKGITEASSLPSGKYIPAFNKNDILISNIRPYFKKIWLASFDGGRSPDVLCFSVLSPKEIEFSYNLLYQDKFFEYMTTTSKGSKMPRGDKSAIEKFSFPLPTADLRSAFSEFISGYYKLINNLNAQSKNLCSIRDSLLPELLTGKFEGL